MKLLLLAAVPVVFLAVMMFLNDWYVKNILHKNKRNYKFVCPPIDKKPD